MDYQSMKPSNYFFPSKTKQATIFINNIRLKKRNQLFFVEKEVLFLVRENKRLKL